MIISCYGLKVCMYVCKRRKIDKENKQEYFVCN